MHGCESGPAVVVNAEVDSMGGVVDGGVGTGLKTSPRRAAIEKAQAELRQEYDVREERRRELEFLEKGGNPLDFRFGNAASLSVQSTSLIDQQAEHVLISEAKGSFALTASTHGDSVESSGRPVVSESCDPNSADNLLLLNGENESREGERNTKRPSKRTTVVPSEQSSQVDAAQNAKETEDLAAVRPYARRYRSKMNRDIAKSNPADLLQDRGTAHGYSKDTKGSVFEGKNQKVKDVPFMLNPKSATSNGDVVKMASSVNQLNMGLVGFQGIEVQANLPKGEVSKTMMNTDASKNLADNKHDEPSQVSGQKTTTDLPSEKPIVVERKERAVSVGSGCPGEVEKKDEKEMSSDQVDGIRANTSRDIKHVPAEQISGAVIAKKGFDSDSSSAQDILSLEVNQDDDMCTNRINVNSNGRLVGQSPKLEGIHNLAGDPMVKEKIEVKAVEDMAELVYNDESAHGNNSVNDSVSIVDKGKRSEVQSESIPVPFSHGAQDLVASEAEEKVGMSEIDKKDTGVPCDISEKENSLADRPQVRIDAYACELPETTMSVKNTDFSAQSAPDNLSEKVHEDSVLEEARIIEAKRKRIAELSAGTVSVEVRQKSQWDFVLEEMVWLANDFSQERLWKMTAAAQICRRVAQTTRMRFEEQNPCLKLRKVAFTLARAVMQFWHSVEVLVNSHSNDVASANGRGLVDSRVADMSDLCKDGTGDIDMDPQRRIVQQHFRKRVGISLQCYAIRFLKQNSFPGQSFQAEAPATPERTSDCGTTETYWDEWLTEESLFYAVPPGAAEAYRISIELCLEQTEKTGSSVQEEVQTSVLDAGADFMYHDDIYDEDDGETSTYDFPGGFQRSKSSKFNQKKRKNLIKSTAARPYEMGSDFAYGNCTMDNQHFMSMGKRPASLNVGSIPTKRVRTGSRQRILSIFSNTAAAGVHPAKTDASSGDTNSLQDDLSTLNGGSMIQKSLEVESVGEFEKQFPYDYEETLERPRKKKKARHLGSAYDQGWKLEPVVYSEQRDRVRKQLEGHHFDSNGNNGSIGQQNAKRPKMMKQQLDNAVDFPPNGSIPSPVASQMSNMSNPNKVIKILGGRDRGRKSKASKISAGQLGSGSPWSLFEDQALVVLVHDMGPNWELVSDAINSALHFKCVFRKPNECKERHRILMDRSGDGADSADDSGSSQSYTLPGIPKGSARQLFQRLQGPIEEDTLKSHFDKIILIGKKQLYRRNQDNNLEQRQIVPVHSSHGIALKQVCPNNLKEVFLTPLDLCDVTPSSQDVLPYQASHTAGSAMSNPGAMALNLPASAVSPSLQGSSAVVGSSILSSPTAPLSTSARDGRFGFPRTPVAGDEQHRTQQYNHILPGRNIQQSNLSVPGAVGGVDRAARMMHGGNAMGVICGAARSMPISRPGFPGIASSSMMNSGSMLSSSMVGMPSHVNMHSGPGSSQGNSMLRPRDGMPMIRPGQNLEHHRQLMVPELQMQVSQGNNPGVPAFNGLSSGFPNQTGSSPVQTYPSHPQQQHQRSPQHSNAIGNSHNTHLQGPNHSSGQQQQAYAIQLAKERQMQQQRLIQKQKVAQQQQQQPFSTGGALAPNVHQQAQLPVSASLQSSSEIQSQNSLSPLGPSSPMTPMSLQHHQKHHFSPYGVNRNPQSGASGLTNQIGKQRLRQQPLQQSGRQHPQHQQQTPSQQAKLLKGMGRGNILVHQNLPIDPSHLNGISVVPGNQAAEKGEQLLHLTQSQSLYAGSGISAAQPSKPLVSPRSSNQSESQRKLSVTPAAKQLHPMPHPDNAGQGQAPLMHQTVLSAVMAPNHQSLPVQSQPNQKQVNQSQPAIQRIHQQNCQLSSDSLIKSQAEQSKSDQLLVNSVSKMDSSTTILMPQACSDSTDTEHTVSSATTQWKSSEPVYNTDLPNISHQLESSGSVPVTSLITDAVPSVSRGLGQGQLSGSLAPQGQGVGAQRQQQPQSQQSSIPQLASQKSYKQHEQLQQDQNHSPKEQLPSQKLSPQVHLQTAQGGFYDRSSNAKLE